MYRAEIAYIKWNINWLKFHVNRAKDFGNRLPKWEAGIAAHEKRVEDLKTALSKNK